MPRSRVANLPAYATLCVFLASLSVKALQEIGGIRVVSTLAPVLLLLLLPRLRVRLPLPVRGYLLLTCLVQTGISIIVKHGPNLYEGYYAITVLSATAVLLACTEGLKLEPRRVARLYADIMVVMCLASVFTLQPQWFGGYSLRGFSDFATFFALQISVGVPFLGGRWVNAKRGICLVTLFLSVSRISLALSLAVVLVQLYQESRASFYKLAPFIVGGAALLATSTSIGNVMADKLANFFTAALGGSVSVDINPSDLGRLAYATVTLEALDRPGVIIAGHGIKTNREIVGTGLDTSIWGLDEDLADATVHNVYLEMLSDSGLIGVTGFVAFLAFAGIRIIARRGVLSPPALAIATFAVSYLFEANYVSFFFQFFMLYFLWVAASPRRTGIRVARRAVRARNFLAHAS